MTHIFDDAERIFYGFLSTRQQILQLIEDDAKDHYLRCDTKDFVEVGLKVCKVEGKRNSTINERIH